MRNNNSFATFRGGAKTPCNAASFACKKAAAGVKSPQFVSRTLQYRHYRVSRLNSDRRVTRPATRIRGCVIALRQGGFT
jgi:hypothetical protein